VETRLRELLQDLAEDMPSHRVPPAGLQRRAHRRIGLTVVGSFLALAVLAFGTFVGIRALVRAERPIPENTGPTAQPPPTLSAPIAVQGEQVGSGGKPQVYLLRPDGTQVPLTSNADTLNHAESWSRDGASLVVQRQSVDRVDLFLVNIDGSPEVRLTNDQIPDGWAQFSPDGSKVAFARGNAPATGWAALEVVNADGSGERRLAAWSGSPTSLGYSWSPDGTRIVFARGSSPERGDDDIYVANVDGTGITRLTTGDHAVCQGAPPQLVKCDRLEDPVWSPDGSRIGFVAVTMPRGGRRVADFEIDVMKADGSGVRQLTGSSTPATGCTFPAWSPDGSELVASCKSGIFVVSADGARIAQVAPPSWYGASWSPDGKEIAVALRDRHIYLVNADGSDLTRIKGGTGAEWGTPLWQPQEEG
jgi:Tol biopolymer transport system component